MYRVIASEAWQFHIKDSIFNEIATPMVRNDEVKIWSLKQMIKGIISLFTSGIILNPMVILGIVFGIIINVNLKKTEVYDVFTNYRIYVLGLILSVIYIVFFKKVYKGKSLELDYNTMGAYIIKEGLRFVFTVFLSISFFGFF